MLATLCDKVKQLKHYQLGLLAIIGSLLASYLVHLQRQPFNVDGILYLHTAAVFLSDGLRAAMATYPWPFYSLLIAGISHITGLPIQHAAMILDAILIALIVLAFVNLIKELGGTRRTQWFSLLVILLYPYLNHDRDNILRDFGYYAFLLVSLQFFIHYLRTFTWRTALAWALSLMVATLFRIEGAIFLMVLPFAALLTSQPTWQKRIIVFLKLQLLNFIGLAIGIVWILFKLSQHDSHALQQLGRINELANFFVHGPALITASFHTKLALLKQGLFADNPFINLPAFLVGGVVGILMGSFLSTIGLFYLVLTCHACYCRLLPLNNAAKMAWLSYLVLNVIIVGIFILIDFFLAERYIVPLCLLLILTAPFSLEAIFTSGKKWLVSVVCLLLLATAVASFSHFGTSKTYLIDAGQWLEKNTPTNSCVFTNSDQITYYSQRSTNTELTDFANNYDYAAVQLLRNQTNGKQHWLDLFKQQPVISFQNKRGDSVMIFQFSAASTCAGDKSCKHFKCPSGQIR
jgi:hypothetical protein